MSRTLNRHIYEVIMILTELFIAVLLMLQLPDVVEIITVCVGILSMIYGLHCIRKYYRATPTYLRYEPELRRGVTLLIIGFIIATMRYWFSVTYTMPSVAFGLTMLMVSFFKVSVVFDARSTDTPHLLFPVISTALTFVLSLIALFSPLAFAFDLWLFDSAMMTLILGIDIYEVYSSEAKKREPWSMQVRCWM